MVVKLELVEALLSLCSLTTFYWACFERIIRHYILRFKGQMIWMNQCLLEQLSLPNSSVSSSVMLVSNEL